MLRKRRFTLILLGLLVVIGSVAGASFLINRLATVAFETVEQCDPCGRWPDIRPTLFIITKIADVEAIRPYISNEASIRLDTLDYEQDFVVAAFQGQQGDDHHRIFQIETISRFGTAINIYAQPDFSDPWNVSAASMTSPYHLITLSKQEIGSGVYTFTLYFKRYWWEAGSMATRYVLEIY